MICTKCGYKCADSDVKCPKCKTPLDDFVFEEFDDDEVSDIDYAKDVEYDNDDTEELDARLINERAKEIEKLKEQGMFEPGVAQTRKYEEKYAKKLSDSEPQKTKTVGSAGYNTDNPYGYSDDYYDDDEEYIEDDYDVSSFCFSDDNETQMNEDSNIRREIEKPPLLTKAKKGVLIATIALIILSVACVFYISKRAMLDKFDASLNNNDYQNANYYYNKLMDKSKDEADEMIVKKIDDIFNRYSKASITSDKAIEELKYLTVLNSGVQESIDSTLTDFDNIQVSENYYEKAQEYYKNGEKENAIMNYFSVTKADNHYKEAQKQLVKVTDEYITAKIKEADALITKDDYDGAITLMLCGLELLEEDEKLTRKLEEYRKAKFEIYKEDIFIESESYFEDKDYANAIKVINSAMESYGDLTELTDKIQLYRDEMLKAVDGYVSENRYDRLVKVLEAYLEIYPEDEEVKKMLAEYSPLITGGYPLAEIDWQSTEGKVYINTVGKEYTDSTGSVFDSVVELCGYAELDNTGKITVKNAGYVKMVGKIGYSSYDYYKEGSGKVVIKADDKVLFESDYIDADTETVDIALDIASTCKNITISWEPKKKTNVKPYGIALGDIKFISEDATEVTE